MNILNSINSSLDIKRLSEEELSALAQELRGFLVESVSKTGGHLASNLGVVELTLALHRVYNTEKDRIVFDVGHQSYAHKIITGRRDRFDTLRQYGGLSGFPKPYERKTMPSLPDMPPTRCPWRWGWRRRARCCMKTMTSLP